MLKKSVLLGLVAGLLASSAYAAPVFNRIASFPVAENAPEAETTSSEIIAASEDGMLLVYSDSPAGGIGMVDITDAKAPKAAGFLAMNGEPTSVTIIGGKAYVAVNTSESYVSPSGKLVVVDLASKTIDGEFDLGGQPDSIAHNKDNTILAIAIENERDEDANDGAIPQAPSGYLVLVDLVDGAVTQDSIRKVELADVSVGDPRSLRPERTTPDGSRLAVYRPQVPPDLKVASAKPGDLPPRPVRARSESIGLTRTSPGPERSLTAPPSRSEPVASPGLRPPHRAGSPPVSDGLRHTEVPVRRPSAAAPAPGRSEGVNRPAMPTRIPEATVPSHPAPSGSAPARTEAPVRTPAAGKGGRQEAPPRVVTPARPPASAAPAPGRITPGLAPAPAPPSRIEPSAPGRRENPAFRSPAPSRSVAPGPVAPIPKRVAPSGSGTLTRGAPPTAPGVSNPSALPSYPVPRTGFSPTAPIRIEPPAASAGSAPATRSLPPPRSLAPEMRSAPLVPPGVSSPAARAFTPSAPAAPGVSPGRAVPAAPLAIQAPPIQSRPAGPPAMTPAPGRSSGAVQPQAFGGRSRGEPQEPAGPKGVRPR